jgi:hypothetical protein
MTNTFRTFLGVYFVVDRTFINGLIWTFRFAHIAVDALVRDHKRHYPRASSRRAFFRAKPFAKCFANNRMDEL